MTSRSSCLLRRFVPLGLCLAATLAGARDNHTGQGSAITPQYSVQRDTLEPDADAVLLACVTNANRHAGREIERGDAFHFEFGDGLLGACTWSGVVGFGGQSLPVGALACSVEDSTLTLAWTGDTTTWAFGSAMCGKVEYHAPAGPSVVATSYDVGNNGAYSPPIPAVLMLGIDGELGAEGPMGPAGPPGPPGQNAVGSTAFAVSTDFGFGTRDEPPALVPGLELDITIAEGARLVVDVDGCERVFDPGCWSNTGGFDPTSGHVLLEVDGSSVAFRSLPYGRPGTGSLGEEASSVPISWLSAPLAAGTHHVAVKVGADPGPGTGANIRTFCVGGPAGSPREARLRVLELRQ